MFEVVFSESTTEFDETDVDVSGMAGTAVVNISGSGDTYTVSISAMADGEFVVATIKAGAIQDAAGNDSLVSTSDDNSVKYDITNPLVTSTDLVAEYTQKGPFSFMVTFSEDVYDPGGDEETDDVTNPANYLLVEAGVNKIFDTTACFAEVAGGWQADDLLITIDSAIYDSATQTATVTLNAGLGLPVGTYQLLICGTTSIVDLAGAPINGGVDYVVYVFKVNEPEADKLPDTGFAPGRMTRLAQQPASKAYASISMKLSIPALKVNMEIVGVPVMEGEWDVSWLGNNAGYLAGSAYPTWAGNTVLTGMSGTPTTSRVLLQTSRRSSMVDLFSIRTGGLTYTYQVSENLLLWGTSDLSTVFQHEIFDVVTLLTCEGYSSFNDNYLFRRMVRAVLIDVR